MFRSGSATSIDAAVTLGKKDYRAIRINACELFGQRHLSAERLRGARWGHQLDRFLYSQQQIALKRRRSCFLGDCPTIIGASGSTSQLFAQPSLQLSTHTPCLSAGANEYTKRQHRSIFRRKLKNADYRLSLIESSHTLQQSIQMTNKIYCTHQF
jgi:hypothetical protein